MWQHALVAGVLSVGLAACAPLGESQAPGASPRRVPVDPSPDAYSHRAGSARVVLYWNCVRPDPGTMRVQGLAHNPHLAEVRFLEFELVGVNDREATVSSARGSAGAVVIRTNQFSPFALDVKTAGSEVRYDLYYTFRAQQILRSQLAAAAPTGAPLLAQAEQRGFVRGACGDRRTGWVR
ncbi:MAG: hypothetical protein ACE147_20030 [Candidatus Methylomirabilales bacterium]